jgi:hypothetical protein
MFVMAWTRRTYHLKEELDMAIDHLRACLDSSPSTQLMLARSWPGAWLLARHKVEGLDERLSVEEACPWSTVDELLDAAEERLAIDRRRFP